VRRLALGLAFAALLALPAAASAYGTTATDASAGAGPWTNLAAAGSATDGGAAASLTESESGGGTPQLFPPNREMTSAAGWTASDTNGVLCTTGSDHDGSQGNPAGSLRTSYAALLNLLNLLADCSTTWRSQSFTWTDGEPADVAFSMDRLMDLNGLVGLATATVTARLVDETTPGSLTLATATVTQDSGWSAMTGAPGPTAIVHGHTYHLEVVVSFASTLSLISGFGVNLDNVTLSVRPGDQRAAGELRAVGVPAGSTHTLEIRARTSGEPFDVQVWDGATWTTRASVAATAPAWGTVSHGLTAAEWNGGTVRVRFADAGTGADPVADTLEVDHLRVVSTGGITVSGPTSVTMPTVTLDGLSAKVSTAALGPVEVRDAGGAASGWTLSATATRWTLDGAPGDQLPAVAFAAAPGAPTTPDGSDLTGVGAGAGGTLLPATPLALMSAAPGAGVGTYRQAPVLSLSVPVTASSGVYRSVITLSAS
jgi:hypothetical protein